MLLQATKEIANDNRDSVEGSNTLRLGCKVGYDVERTECANPRIQ